MPANYLNMAALKKAITREAAYSNRRATRRKKTSVAASKGTKKEYKQVISRAVRQRKKYFK